MNQGKIIPTDGIVISDDTVLQSGVYYLPNGIHIAADGITLDGNGAVIIGKNRKGRGVTIHTRQGVTVKNLRARDYEHGIYAKNCQGLTITGCQVTSTKEVPPNTVFLDIWLPAERAYGGGILLWNVMDSLVEGNDLQHQMAGLLAYDCQRLRVLENNASFCSGFGFHIYETSDSLYEGNCADYCCRWEPRGGRTGHMGADAAGFLIIHNSSRNIFRRNLARLGGDGFFLAGLSPELEPVPCNDNLFEENDGSWSPNIAFEATFSAGNVWRNNYANHCNYGFWLGFSRDSKVLENQVNGCRQAGIATENGINFEVRGNSFQDCGHGILLWSKHIPEFLTAVPDNTTSAKWLIEGNQFFHNNKAIRIAANQDHGIRPYKVPEGEDPGLFQRPQRHTIRNNSFVENWHDFDIQNTDGTVIED